MSQSLLEADLTVLLEDLQAENAGKKPTPEQLVEVLGIPKNDAKEILKELLPLLPKPPKKQRLRKSEEAPEAPPAAPAKSSGSAMDVDDTLVDPPDAPPTVPPVPEGEDPFAGSHEETPKENVPPEVPEVPSAVETPQRIPLKDMRGNSQRWGTQL